jgi:hypothetical protein
VLGLVLFGFDVPQSGAINLHFILMIDVSFEIKNLLIQWELKLQ